MRTLFRSFDRHLTTAGEIWTTRGDFLKALAAFTRFSRYVRCTGAAYHDRVARERLMLGRLLLAVMPKPPLPLMRDIAAIAEGLGEEAAFRAILRKALRRAAEMEKDLSARPGNLGRLVDFRLCLLDLPGAWRATVKGNALGAEGAERLLEDLTGLEAECAPWRHAIDAAAANLQRRIAGAPEKAGAPALVLRLPAAAFRSKPTDYAGFRQDIRRTFRQVVEVLDRQGVPYRPMAQLAQHCDLADAGAPFVSYHTIGGGGAGLHVKETDRRAHFSADAGGYSGWAAFAGRPASAFADIDGEAVAAFIAREKAQLIGGNESKYAQPNAGDPMPGRPYVFVALQIVDDAVQRLAHMHMFGMLEEVAAACRRRGLPLLVKRHPLCASPAVARVLKRGERLGLFSVSKASVHRLIAQASAVCVVNSSVGAEALLHGKPVYCFGAAEYQAATFVIRRRGEFDAVFEPGRLPVPPKEIESLLFALRNRFATNVRDEASAAAFWQDALAPLLRRLAADA